MLDHEGYRSPAQQNIPIEPRQAILFQQPHVVALLERVDEGDGWGGTVRVIELAQQHAAVGGHHRAGDVAVVF